MDDDLNYLIINPFSSQFPVVDFVKVLVILINS